MSTIKRRPNIPIFGTFSIVYILLVFLFAWQTWAFVDWLFPADQLLMKILLVFSFDGMALLWLLATMFYPFASAVTHRIADIGYWISFTFATAASVLYLVIQSMFRFQITVSQVLVNWAYGITIVVLVFNILMIMIFLKKEKSIRYPINLVYLDEIGNESLNSNVSIKIDKTNSENLNLDSPKRRYEKKNREQIEQFSRSEE